MPHPESYKPSSVACPMTDRERWNRIEALFFGALERDLGERTSFLDAESAGEAEMRAEVEAMLAAHEHGQGLLLENRFLTGESVDLPHPDALLGSRLGAYRLKSLLGRGGMGAVYLAERDDAQYRQEVALKLIRPGLHTADVVARFRAERQILARLQHPHIARLLDGGVTDDGLPFLVMEYVAGTPITAFCDAQRLPIAERLRLFRTVCQAVQFAHRNLIVHRDLKPSNIFVTDDGEIKLLDFGIAKLLDPASVPVSMPLTRAEMRLLTPEYAAPEQVRGETITTATDVYALGVLLYELLTGRRPYRLPERRQAEVERIICEEEPTRPSTAVAEIEQIARDDGTTETVTPERVSAARSTAAARLRRTLQGDLDNIVMMALRKEPGRRYTTAEQVAEDLERYLDGRPVIAQKDTLAYRMDRFVRRHAAAVVSAVLIVLLLISGLATVVWQARVAAMERDRARLQASRAEHVSTFLIDLFESPDPAEALGDTLTAYDLLERGLRRIDRDLTGQPLLRATLLNTLGQTYLSMGQHSRASALLDSALVLRRKHLGPSPDVAQAMTDLGWVEALEGRHLRAESLYTEALATQRRFLGERHEDVAATLSRMAGMLQQRGDFEASEQVYLQALELMRELYRTPHPAYAGALQHLALLLWETGRYDEAEPLMEQALRVQRTLRGPAHPDLALLLNDYAMLLQNQGRPEQADTVYREALAMQRQLFGSEHPQLVYTLVNLSTVVDDHDLAEADDLTAEALQIARAIFEPSNPVLANAMNMRAQLLQRRGLIEEAGVLFEEALETARRAFPADHPRVGWAEVGLGSILFDQGNVADAERHIRAGLQVLIDAFGPDHRITRQAEAKLTAVLEAQRRAGSTSDGVASPE
jgi:eukaryotic-like serine/threonine-protein kinase